LRRNPQVRSARPRRYCFYEDEIAEAEAQGLPYVLAPRVLSREEWEKKYSLPAPAETKCDRTPSDESLVLSNE
jgi:hypothetical protein